MKILFVSMFCLAYISVIAQDGIRAKHFSKHLNFLASDKLEGRYPGTRGNEIAYEYVQDCFKRFGLKKFNGSYLQSFDAVRRSDSLRIPTYNVVGFIEGQDENLKGEYIVIGAHYDHLGWGGKHTGSKNKDTNAIHNGADDNASGTAMLLELAQELARNRKQLKRSIVFVAFGAEEFGLQGSKFFVNNLPVAKESIQVMINMDMVGRLNSENHLYMGGAGTFPGGVEFMKAMGEGSGLNLIVHAGGVGGSDHVSFYRQNISAIGMHTGGHDQYHLPTDDASLINSDGAEKVGKYIYNVLLGLSRREEKFGFVKQD